MNPIIQISLILIIALIATAVLYFQAACKLSVAENWLSDFKDLRDWRKNRALTRRLMRAILGSENVCSPRCLRQVKARFYLLLMSASATLVWAVGLFWRSG
ncbi:hypothetical protein ACKLNO_00745 [Neisseriaceae bacterium B1]